MPYEASLDSLAATFDSPSMSANEVGILVQYDSGGGDNATPTWDGNAMTLAKLQQAGGSSTSIWYITGPTAGVTTIARGTGVDYCVAIRASDIAWGTTVGDTTGRGGGGQGHCLMQLDGVLLQDVLVSSVCVSDGVVGINYQGAGSVKQSADFGADIANAATSEGEVGDTIEVGWDYGTTGDTSACAAVFKGRARPGGRNVIFLA